MWVSEQRRFVDGTRPVSLPVVCRQHDWENRWHAGRVTSRSVHSWPLGLEAVRDLAGVREMVDLTCTDRQRILRVGGYL